MSAALDLNVNLNGFMVRNSTAVALFMDWKEKKQTRKQPIATMNLLVQEKEKEGQ